MAKVRTLFSMVVAHGLIYAIGGEDEFACMKLVEYYDPKKNAWTNTTPMIKPRAGAGVAVFNNAIYAVGGSTMFKYGDTDTVERYDLETKQWSLVRLGTKTKIYFRLPFSTSEPSRIFSFHEDHIDELFALSRYMRCVRELPDRSRRIRFRFTSSGFCGNLRRKDE